MPSCSGQNCTRLARPLPRSFAHDVVRAVRRRLAGGTIVASGAWPLRRHSPSRCRLSASYRAGVDASQSSPWRPCRHAHAFSLGLSARLARRRRCLVRHEWQALGTASGQHGRRDPRGTAAVAVVVDDRVAVGGAGPNLRVAVARHSPPEDDAAVALRSALPDDDDLAGPRGTLPRERHARIVDPRLDPEDVRRPAACVMPNARGSKCCACRAPRRPGRSYRRLRRLCRLRACARGQGVRRCGFAAKRYPNRGGVPAAEQRSGDCTHDEDEHGEYEHPPPAAGGRGGRRFDCDRRRLGRRNRRRFDDDRWGRGWRRRPRPLDDVRKQPPRLLGKHGVDEHELGADWLRVPRAAVRPCVHPNSLASASARRRGRASKPKKPVFARNLAPKARIGRGVSRPML